MAKLKSPRRAPIGTRSKASSGIRSSCVIGLLLIHCKTFSRTRITRFVGAGMPRGRCGPAPGLPKGFASYFADSHNIVANNTSEVLLGSVIVVPAKELSRVCFSDCDGTNFARGTKRCQETEDSPKKSDAARSSKLPYFVIGSKGRDIADPSLSLNTVYR